MEIENKKTITVIKGDGICPEIVTEALKVMNRIAEKFNHTFIYQEAAAGEMPSTYTVSPFPKIA